MYTPQHVGSLLIVYMAFVIGSCAACRALFQTTASNVISTPQNAASQSQTNGSQTNYSRVEGWQRRQSIAKLKNPTPVAKVLAADDNGDREVASAPERDLARAIVLAAAIDSADHNIIKKPGAGQSHMGLVTRRVRVPSCDALPCSGKSKRPLEIAGEIAGLNPLVKPLVNRSAKVKTQRVAARPTTKIPQRIAQAVEQKITGKADKTARKLQKMAAKNAAVAQERVKSERRIALRRFRETPAEISYRSFVGSFVSAI